MKGDLTEILIANPGIYKNILKIVNLIIIIINNTYIKENGFSNFNTFTIMTLPKKLISNLLNINPIAFNYVRLNVAKHVSLLKAILYKCNIF